jgi:hypothetical protein
MKAERILVAQRLARTFIAAVDVLHNTDPEKRYEITGSKASGAVRRASLELTRALAEMRKAR